ncbi:MAG: hypothetical protein C0471_08465 [Erythrobacter sp.]|nr:hypothetical protein [Erythrobacter sp.]
MLALAAAGCDPVPRGDADYVSPELQEQRNNLLACFRDVDQVPLERSEHCVIAAEILFDFDRQDCTNNRSAECETHGNEWSNAVYLYDQAVISSLVTHGPTLEAERLVGSRRELKRLFHDPKPLHRLFNQCLSDEERMLQAQGLTKVTSIVDIPLAPGQRCFRKDYPEFRTKKASVS